MLQKFLNVTLLIATIVGAVLAYRAVKKHRELSAEHQRLEAKVGSLPIGDPSKVHVRAIPTGEKLHFAWRVYVPAGFQMKLKYGSGSGTTMYSSAHQFIIRARFQEYKDGTFQVFIKRGGGASLSQLGDQDLANLLHERWDEVQVEQLGVKDVTVIEADEIAHLLRLTLPDDLQQQAEETVRPSVMRQFKTGLLDIRFGTDAAFQKAEAREALLE